MTPYTDAFPLAVLPAGNRERLLQEDSELALQLLSPLDGRDLGSVEPPIWLRLKHTSCDRPDSNGTRNRVPSVEIRITRPLRTPVTTGD